MVRKLLSAPEGLIADGAPRFGSFRGGLPRLDFGRVDKGRLWQLTHKKRWTYVAIASDEVYAGMAVVSLSYAATSILFVLDRRTGELLVDRSTMAPFSAVRFSDEGQGQRSAAFSLGRTQLHLGDEQVSVDLPGGPHPTHIFARTVGAAAEPISAVVPIDGGFANATEKRVARVQGEVVAGGRRFLLDGAHAAWDHTAGYLARHTAWRWALGLGEIAGRRVAFNLVQGFVGEAECGGWLGDTLHPFGEGRFEVDLERPTDPWRVRTTCGAVDLTFRPAAIHAESTDVWIVRSKFIQPVGSFEGTLRFGDEVVTVKDLPGVTEHQDVLW